MIGLVGETFSLDLFGEWSMSVGQVLLSICGTSMLIGLITEIVVSARRRRSWSQSSHGA